MEKPITCNLVVEGEADEEIDYIIPSYRRLEAQMMKEIPEFMGSSVKTPAFVGSSLKTKAGLGS